MSYPPSIQVSLKYHRLVSSTSSHKSGYAPALPNPRNYHNRRNTFQSLPLINFNQFTFNSPVKGSPTKSPNLQSIQSSRKTFYGYSEVKKEIRMIEEGYKTMKIGSALKYANQLSYKKLHSEGNRIKKDHKYREDSKNSDSKEYQIKFLLPPKKHLSLCVDNCKKVQTIEGFLKEHEFISQSSKEAYSIQSLNRLQTKLINEWKYREPPEKSLRSRVLKIIYKLKQLKLTVDDITSGEVLSSSPYQKVYSKELINACKEGSLELVKTYLNKNKFLVYDFDHTKKTGLHWAAIRSHYKIMELLIQNNADIDAQDYSFKTPLHYAAQKNDVASTRLLLSCEADPFMHCSLDLEPRDLTTSGEILGLLKKVRKIHIIMKWVPWEEQKDKMKLILKDINTLNDRF